MQTIITKWDESMAVRCLARSQDDYAQTAYQPRRVGKYKTSHAKATPVKATQEIAAQEIAAQDMTSPEKTLSINIVAGEWDDFQYALSNTLKKNHK